MKKHLQIGFCFTCGEKTDFQFKALNLFQCLKCKHESEKEIEMRNKKGGVKNA